MKTYDLFHIARISSSILIISTNQNILEWVTELINKKSPTAKVYKPYLEKQIEETQGLDIMFKELDNKEAGIVTWLVQVLCHNGWEPFGNIKFLESGIESITLRNTRE